MDLKDIRNQINDIDENMAFLFEKRMNLVKEVIDYKLKNGLPILDSKREDEVVERNLKFIKQEPIKPFYKEFITSIMNISKKYQTSLSTNIKEIRINGDDKNNYSIYIERGIINDIKKYFNVNRKVLIITDDLVPKEYIDTVKKQIEDSYVYTFNHGEKNKSIETINCILEYLSNNNFTRTDAVIAIGGGVVGDTAALAASLYMRGIDFYNIPTTLLSQVDSSIGGKVAVNFNGIKNNIGQFYFPKCVLIDPDTLKTLSKRLVSEGLAEAIKMAITSNKDLFNLIKNSTNLDDDIEKIIYEALKIKAQVVLEDPLEKGIRKVLNFGHTIGHAVEALSDLYHGECVSIGMMYMIDKDIEKEIKETLEKYNLPVKTNIDLESIKNLIKHDKKASGDEITIVYVSKIGSFEFKKIKIDDVKL